MSEEEISIGITHPDSLHGQLESFLKEKAILLDLSNEITRIRTKDDLILALSSRLKSFFHFTHAVISLVDWREGTYYPFLLDIQAHPNKDHNEFNSIITRHNSLHDPFFRRISKSDGPVSVLLEDILEEEETPAFVKLHYSAGIRRALVLPLKNRMELLGFLYISSDRTEDFSKEFDNVLKGISPLLANAVANIIINEEIAQRERVNEILLSLSNDIVTVRDRPGLLHVIKSGLRKLIYFTHIAMAELDDTGKYYHTFLTDPDSRAKKLPEYNEMIKIPQTVADGIYDVASRSPKPIIINLSTVNMDTAPLWLKFNYTAGGKEIMLKALPGKGTPRHTIILFSDRVNTFDEKAVGILQRICSQLSTAVSNIAANEEILAKDKDKTFLLNFSHDVAAARTKMELSSAVHAALKNLSEVRAYFIRTINDDGATMSPFMHDKEVFYLDSPAFSKLLTTRIPVDVGITAKVLGGNSPVLIDFAEEIRKGNSDHYIEFWKTLGSKKSAFQKMFGTPLRMGNTDLGVLWVITPKINITLLEGICAQISVALSNIKSNEEIREREEEKSILLSISDEIASMRSREDLSRVLDTRIKKLLGVTEFGLTQISDDRLTYSSFVLALGDRIRAQRGFEDITTRKYQVSDPVFTRILASNDPVVFDVERLAMEPGVPAYVHFWKSAGIPRVIASALRVGGKNIGCVFLHTESNKQVSIKTNLLKAVCAQMSVGVSNILANEQVLRYKQMLEVENDHLKEQIEDIYNFSDIVGSGVEMQKVYRMMSLVAGSNSTVLLLGETGTGKELIARAIHNASPRKGKLMIKVNCAALPANLIESELFGHEKGSFTGALERRIGKFEMANHSTLFLDEIGELPVDMQVKLLRAIQEREIERVGGKATITIDVRIIAATNRNLEEEIKTGRFRSDLYYRLNVFPIVLPPLRDRHEDIVPLASFFLARHSKNSGRKVTSISEKVINELKRYGWPGNVRELEHLIERSILFTDGDVLREIQLPGGIGESTSQAESTNGTLDQIERLHIIETLRKCNGKISGYGGAAELLGIPSTTLHSKMKKLGISKADYVAKHG